MIKIVLKEKEKQKPEKKYPYFGVHKNFVNKKIVFFVGVDVGLDIFDDHPGFFCVKNQKDLETIVSSCPEKDYEKFNGEIILSNIDN